MLWNPLGELSSKLIEVAACMQAKAEAKQRPTFIALQLMSNILFKLLRIQAILQASLAAAQCQSIPHESNLIQLPLLV